MFVLRCTPIKVSLQARFDNFGREFWLLVGAAHTSKVRERLDLPTCYGFFSALKGVVGRRRENSDTRYIKKLHSVHTVSIRQ